MKTFKEFLGEAVEVDTHHYEFSSGRKPKGHGSWIFTRSDVTSRLDFDKHKENEHYVVVNGAYGDAKKKAQKWAQGKGYSAIGVAP